MKSIAIIGSGSWGAAIAIHLAKNGNKVKLWAFSEEDMNHIKQNQECRFLPGVKIPKSVECTLDYKEAIEGTDMIVHVTPSKFVRENVQKYKEYV